VIRVVVQKSEKLSVIFLPKRKFCRHVPMLADPADIVWYFLQTTRTLRWLIFANWFHICRTLGYHP
jgi:hypothetical protein